MMLYFLVLALLSNFSIAADQVSAAAFDLIYWKKILHYQNEKSLADGEKFFLSPVGKFDPDAELSATVLAFRDPNAHAGWFNYHPQCVFRERFRFLKSKGFLEGIKEQPCPEFDEWKKGLNPESVTLIFSSSYPNNPSSLFGHTLLRINQKNKSNDLLDYAVAFSAIPEKDDLGIVFAAKGMFGGYKGLFEVTKYYTKVNEYNNGESRDLIEYNLNMNDLELERLINHLWELYQTTYFDYYFADENCSAVLADLLGVALYEDTHVSDHARWYYLPGEMIKHFYETPGRVKSVVYRPSLKKSLLRSWQNLSSEELNSVKEIIQRNELSDDISNIKILDVVAEYLNFSKERLKRNLTVGEASLLRKVLLQRAKLGLVEIIPKKMDEKNRPELGHDPQKISLTSRIENQNPQALIEIKQGFHDLMARDLGYDPFSHFDFGIVSLLFDFKKKKLDYDSLVFVNLVSLHEYLFFDPQFSWRAKVVSERIYDLSCSLCHKQSIEALGGLSIKPNEYSVMSFMMGAAASLSHHFIKGHRLGPVLGFSYYGQFGEYYKLGITNDLYFDATKRLKEDYYNQIGIRHSFFTNEKSDIRLESYFISKFSKFTKNTMIHQVGYGLYF